LSASASNAWASTLPDEQTNNDLTKAQEAQRRADILNQTISDVLLSDNILILAGLRTSLSVNAKDNTPVVPTMDDLWNAAKEIAGVRFDEIVKTANYKTIKRDNIELLLSQCHI